MTRDRVNRRIALSLPAALGTVTIALAASGIIASTNAAPVDVVERSGVVATHDDGEFSSALSAFREETRGASPSKRAWGCVMIQTRVGTDRGCGPLSVTTDTVRGSARVTGAVESEAFDPAGRSLGPSSISVTATSSEAGPAPSPCQSHHALIDPVQNVEITAGVRRQATIGWEVVSQLLGRHFVTPGIGRTGDRYFYIDETGVIRPTADATPTCQPISG